MAFLLSYKLVQYISKFKILERNSRIDIVFVITFLGLLFVPMSYISSAQKNIRENRMLANYPQLFENTLNLNFGKQFETWFNDRFRGRNMLIDFYTEMKYGINRIYQNNKAIFFKNSGWMFGKPIAVNPPRKNMTDKIVSEIKKFDDVCRKNNIRLYILIVPRKESIYGDILRGYGYSEESNEKVLEYIGTIQESLSDNRVIYPYEELKNGIEKDFVFFKQSHHWTDFGAYLGYEILAQRIKQDFPDFEVVNTDNFAISQSTLIRDDWGRDYNRGHTTKLLNLQNRPDTAILNTLYNYYDPKTSEAITEERKEYIKIFNNKAAGNNYKVFMTGNSQNEDLLQFISASVKYTKYLRLNKNQLPYNEQYKFMKYYKNELLNYKPDIFIVTISLGKLPQIAHFLKD